MRKQYHFRPVQGSGFDAWDVDRLVTLSRGLPVVRVPARVIGEIDTEYWFDGRTEILTARKVVDHARRIAEADLSFPVVLGHDGQFMDGMHRIARALLEGRHAADAVRLAGPIEPDYGNCLPDELPYD